MINPIPISLGEPCNRSNRLRFRGNTEESDSRIFIREKRPFEFRIQGQGPVRSLEEKALTSLSLAITKEEVGGG